MIFCLSAGPRDFPLSVIFPDRGLLPWYTHGYCLAYKQTLDSLGKFGEMGGDFFP